jgi:hypothetical protein
LTTGTSIPRRIILCLFAAEAIAIADLIARSSGSPISLTGLAKRRGEITRAHHGEAHRFAWPEWICDHNEQARRSHCRRRDEPVG